MDDIVIESATIGDVEDIVKLENSYQNDRYSYNQLKEMFDYDYYVILKCVIDKKVVGYLCATILYEECNLLKIIVDSNYRRCGIGNKLILRLCQICGDRQAKSIFLEVRCNNEVAIKFYEKLCFEYQGERLGYYNGIDAKIYRLNI